MAQAAPAQRPVRGVRPIAPSQNQPQSPPIAKPKAGIPRVRPIQPDPLVSGGDSLVAEEPAKPAPKEPLEIKFSKSLNLDLQGQYFPEKLSSQVNQGFGIVKGELSTSLKIGKMFLLKFRPTGRWDPENKSDSEKYWADVPEGYGQVRVPLGSSGSWTSQAGYNTWTWGVTDGFNPVDVVNARRFHDPLASEKLGALSWTNKLDFGSVLVEGIWIPEQRRSKLPGSSSRWLPREVSRSQLIDNTLFRVPENHVFYFRDYQEYDDALSNNIGGRLGLKVLGLDLGFYAFDGAATVPATNLRLTGAVVAFVPGQTPDLIIDADPPIGLRPIYYRQTMIGGSVVAPVGPVLVRAEVAHTKPKRKAANVPVKVTESAFEVEHTITGESSSLTLIGMVTVADTEDPENTNSSTSFGRMFDRAAVFGLRYTPVETFTGELFTVFDTKYGGRLHKLELTKTLNDHWKLYGGGEIFAGKIETPIGVYRKNDRVIAGVKLAL